VIPRLVEGASLLSFLYVIKPIVFVGSDFKICLDGLGRPSEPLWVGGEVSPDDFLQLNAPHKPRFSLSLINRVEAPEVHELHIDALWVPKVRPAFRVGARYLVQDG
jgi:hypothetical protein